MFHDIAFRYWSDLTDEDIDWAMGEDGPGACDTCGRNPALEACPRDIATPCHERVLPGVGQVGVEAD